MATLKTQTGHSRIKATVPRTIGGKAKISVTTTTTTKTRAGVARIKRTPAPTQTGVTRIKKVPTQTQTGVSNIQTTPVPTQTGVARIKKAPTQTQTGKSRVLAPSSQTQNGKARIGLSNLVVYPAASPGLTVTYGGFAISEANGCILSSEYDCTDTAVSGSFYIEFRLRLLNPTGNVTTDDATFSAMVRAVESDTAGLRVPRQRLLVKLRSSTLKDWSFSGTQTAILIEPELKLIQENARDYHYGFRVHCQFQGNVPGNVYRRESMTQIGASLQARRTCSITATWTSSDGVTAYARYLASGDAFYTSVLPSNGTDQYGNTGTWVQASEDPQYNDEDSLIQAPRVYWELFAGRRDSTTTTLSRIDGRRICTIPSTWVASGSNTALQNYLDNGDAFFGAVLPDPVTAGDWVLADQQYGYNDQNKTLSAIHTYHECVAGLRDFQVESSADAAGLRTLVVSGQYYKTRSISAKTNYDNNIQGLINAAIGSETPALTHYETHSVPKIKRYDTTGLRYFFQWTIRELAYPQGPSGYNDANVTLEMIDIKVNRPFDGQAVTTNNPITRLKRVVANFVATIDLASSNGTDPVALWDSGLRSHVLTAVKTKLGSDVSTVQVVDENVGVGLHLNQLVGRLDLVVTGNTTVLWVRISQAITQVPGRDFVARADGTAFSYYPYRVPPEKLLYREALCEFVVGNTPTLFGAGDNTVSGYGLIDTGITAQDSIDAQNAAGQIDLGQNWFIDRRAPAPYTYSVTPSEQGDGLSAFQTVIVRQTEAWRYVAALEPGTDIP